MMQASHDNKESTDDVNMMNMHTIIPVHHTCTDRTSTTITSTRRSSSTGRLSANNQNANANLSNHKSHLEMFTSSLSNFSHDLDDSIRQIRTSSTCSTGDIHIQDVNVNANGSNQNQHYTEGEFKFQRLMHLLFLPLVSTARLYIVLRVNCF
jgi:hypothetical protein